MKTPSETLDLLRRAVEAKGPDYVYVEPEGDVAACLYVHDGQPSCIVGHVLNYCGLLGLAEENKAPSNIRALREHFDSAALVVLDAAQEIQDNGEPWGEALACAEVTAEGLL